jgi:hypothetical protein
MCKAMVAKAREVGRCMTVLPITLGANEYRTYLAAWTGSTNMINDELIEILRMNASLFVETKTRMLTAVGTQIPCGEPFQPRYKNLNVQWIETSPTLQLAVTPIDVADLTEDWDEVMPIDEEVLDFGLGGIYDRQVVLDIKEFLQTLRATTGVAMFLARQSIHTGLGALEPGNLFTELEDIKWTLWGQWTDFAEKYRGPASITIFSLLCLRLLTWAGGLFCRCCGPQRALQVDDHGAGGLFPQLHGVSTSETRGV